MISNSHSVMLALAKGKTGQLEMLQPKTRGNEEGIVSVGQDNMALFWLIHRSARF